MGYCWPPRCWGGNGYLLWSGVAAVITGLVVWLVPLGWEWQGVMFAVLTLLAAWLWWKWLARRVRGAKPADSPPQSTRETAGRPPLYSGNRAGQRTRPHARRRQLLAVSADADLSAGTQVEVIAIEGITLRIKAV
ncbi:Inner membrane protein ybbJ [Citrobacter koseri]|uniref:Inner membrane protein ybbJ n=1 Tax=Citrobacter koseri TaxID=545 RepID=A0A2X2X5V5_CITKO|nr:Inner membrane protein ybbJ [Citrobacter koseri]